jgi:hypothetical protein
MRKNVGSQIIGAQMVNISDGLAFTGTARVAITIDGGVQDTTPNGTVTHEGRGYHSYNPSQAETNGDIIAFTFDDAGGLAVPVTVQVYTIDAISTDVWAEGTRTLTAAANITSDASPINVSSGIVDTVTTSINVTTVNGLAANVITASAIAADAIGASEIADGAIDAGSIAPGALNGKGDWNTTTPPTADIISDAVWDEDATAHQTTGTFGQAIGDPGINAKTLYAALITDAVGASVTADMAIVDTVVNGIQTDLDNGTDGLGAIKADTAAILVDTSTTLQAELDGIQADTEDIQTRLPATLVGGRMDSNLSAINDVAGSALLLEGSISTNFGGTASGTPTTTTMVSDVGVTVDDQFKGRTIIFDNDTTTAALQGQATNITACTASTNTLTFTDLTTAPASGDTFQIV